MPSAYIIDSRDNVATALQAARAGEAIILRGDAPQEHCIALGDIRPEHKFALVAIPSGQPVIKYGMPIGHAVKDIAAGEWVHLHNCASNYDARSNTLDHESGAPTDTPYV